MADNIAIASDLQMTFESNIIPIFMFNFFRKYQRIINNLDQTLAEYR